jgi:hypothetical protein
MMMMMMMINKARVNLRQQVDGIVTTTCSNLTIFNARVSLRIGMKLLLFRPKIIIIFFELY